METITIAAKVLAGLAGPAGKWAWKKIRDPRKHAMARVASGALAQAIAEIGANDKVTEVEISALVDLVDSALDANMLINMFFEASIRDYKDVTHQEFVFAMIQLMRENDIDVDAMLLPVDGILDRFVVIFPREVAIEAAQADSPLFHLAVMEKLEVIIHGTRASTIDNVHEVLHDAVAHLTSGDAARLPIGLDMILGILNQSPKQAALVFDVICGSLRHPTGASWNIYIQARIIEFLRELLLVLQSMSEPPWIDLDLRGVNLKALDLSGVTLNRLMLDDARITGNLRLRRMRIASVLSMKNCEVEGVADRPREGQFELPRLRWRHVLWRFGSFRNSDPA